jgi:hypothetical protein
MNVDEKKYITAFKKDKITVNGFSLPKKYEQLKEQLDDLEVNDCDVWIVTFPKSGTTWTEEMVWMIMNNLDFQGAQKFLHLRCPFLEESMLIDDTNKVQDNSGENPNADNAHSINYLKSLTSPIVVKTHLPFQLLPKQIKNNIKNPKMIYVTRDPRDTCVSRFHHARLLGSYGGDLETFCKMFLEGKVTYGPYWSHILPFWQMRGNPNLLLLKYEEMKHDLRKVIRQVSLFLERPLTDEQVEILNQHLTFDKMKQNPAVNYEELFAPIKKNRKIGEEEKFMRKGIVGDYKNAMSADMIRAFDEWIEKNIQNTDYVIS